jgi:acetyl-CoA carboxylase biotin carboxylase subunit
MIAKLIAWDHDRPRAIARMLRALNEFVIEGVKTTIPFHVRVLATEEFHRGDFGTDFLDEFLRREKQQQALKDSTPPAESPVSP